MGTVARRRTRRWGALATVVALVAGLLMVSATIAPAPPAHAATVAIGTIGAQMANQQGVDAGTSGNCIRYAPSSGTGSSSTSSAWVTNTVAGLPNSATTAHGYSTSCPTNLSTSSQSALGFRPSTVTSAEDGMPFLIGGMTHYNNPIQANDQYFTGELRTQLGGFSGTTVAFNWTMNETPNTGSGNCCNDITSFTNQISDVTLTQGGLTYRLVILGFVPAASATSCPATPAGNPVNEFSTVEGAQTNACLYASLQQVRTLRIVKNVVGSPPGTPSFSYNSTSTLTGSAWANTTFSLASGGTVERPLTSGSTVTVTEGDPADDRWSLTGLTCQQYNALGVLVDLPGTGNLAARRVSLDPVPAPLYPANPVVICTFTNTYTPRTTLTLVKSVTGAVVSPSLFTLTATGTASPTSGTVVSGASGSAAVTNQRIVAGTYQLTELGTGAAATGFVQVGSWTCARGSTTYPVSPTGVVTLPDLPAGSAVGCTVVNRAATGTLRISKVVDDPQGGYVGGTGQSFAGTYNCGAGFSGSFSTLTTAAAVTVTGIPAGRACTVSENGPTGGLLNASFAWGTPSYSAQPVTITDQATADVTITNPVVQRLGSFAVTKSIDGPGGYTGGVNRVFPVAYSCTLTNGPTTAGTLDLTAAQAVSPAAAILAGSVCTFSETLTAQAGDFGDPSYAWSGYTVTPTSVTIGDDATAQVGITNTYGRDTGSLVLAKQIQGDGYIGTGEPFTVQYTCGVASGQVTLAAGGSATVSVPARNTCTAAEVPPAANLLQPAYVWGNATWSDGTSATNSVTVPANGTATLTVTNPTIPVFGRVQVGKQITGETAGVTAAASFQITVSCSNAYTGTFTVGVGGTALTPDLPVGTSCSFSEATPTGGLVDSSYQWGTPVLPGPVTITASNQVPSVVVTNPVSRVYGDLEISKQLVDPSGRVDRQRQYTIDYACSYAGVSAANGTVQLFAGESTVIPDILLESRCTVVEDPTTLDAPPVADDTSWVWLPPTYDPGTSVLITSPDLPATVTVTNRTNQLTGTFQLTKSVVGDGKALGYQPGSQFTFAVECTDGYESTVDLADGQSWTPDRAIASGSSCTITETGKPDPLSPAFGWDDVEFGIGSSRVNGSITIRIPETATPIQVNAVNPITPRFGSLELTKQVTGQTAGLVPGTTFDVNVSCGPGDLFTVTLTEGEPRTLTGIPVGVSCTVAELPPDPAGLVDASYGWGPATYDPGATVTIAQEGQQVEVAIVNPIVRVGAPVRVVKSLTGGQGVIDPARTYPITWSCSYGGQQVAGGTLDAVVDPTGVVVDQDVPLTAQCTATEGDLGVPSDDPAYRWLAPTVTGTTVTADGQNAVTVANALTRDTGEVVVHKTVTGASEGYLGTGADFTMHGQCAVPGTDVPTRYADGTIANLGTVTIAPVSVGWTCSGFEDTPAQSLLADTSYAWGAPIITGTPALTPPVGGTFTLAEAGARQDFFVENPVVRVRSTFQITKNVVDPFGALIPGTQFSGTFSCRYGTDDPVTGNWTLTNGDTFTGPAVYLNSQCTVTENDLGTAGLPDASFDWAAPVVGDPVTVVPGGTATITVTNTIERQYGGLEVGKVLDDPDGGVRPDTDFTGVWTCTLGAQTWSDRWEVGAGATATLFTPADARVPATAVCAIIEDTPDPARLLDGSYAWGDRTYTPESVTLVADETAQLSVTNTVQRVYSGFDVAKAITGSVADDDLVPVDRVFTGTFSCQYGSDAPVTGPWTASVATAWVQAGILVGSVCQVTEEVPPGAGGQPVTGDSSYIWGTPDLGSSVTVTPPTEANQTVTVTNPTERLFGRFTLTKAVTGATDGITDPQPFPVTYSCQPGDGPAITGSTALAAGQTLTVGPDPGDDLQLFIPVSSICTLTEPLATMPPLRDSSWTWGDPGFTVVGDIPTAGPVTVPCADPLLTPCLGERSVTVTIPRPQEDYPDPPSVGLDISNPVLTTDGSYAVSKSSDPASGTVVAPGSTITYSVTVTSTGEVPVHDVVVTDDLSAVLPYAVIGSISDPAAVLDPQTQQLVWTVGDVPGGQSRTLTYQATVNPGVAGVSITNQVTSTADVRPSSCAEPGDPVCTTTHRTPDRPTISKQVDGDPVFDPGPGTWTVPYAIVVTNPNPDTAITYSLTDNIAFPTDATIVSAAVTSAPDGVSLFEPAWTGGDQTTIAQDVPLNGGASHTYGVAVTATVPLTIDPARLACAATGSGGGSGFFNIATLFALDSSAMVDACAPVPVFLVVDKQWVIDGVTYRDGTQPLGYSATLTLDGVDRVWRTVYWSDQPGTTVDVGERAVVPASCTSASSGTGPVTLTAPLTSTVVTNVVTCVGPTPGPTSGPTPGPVPPHPTPLPVTGFAVGSFLGWGLGLLLIGAAMIALAGWRPGRRRSA